MRNWTPYPVGFSTSAMLSRSLTWLASSLVWPLAVPWLRSSSRATIVISNRGLPLRTLLVCLLAEGVRGPTDPSTIPRPAGLPFHFDTRRLSSVAEARLILHQDDHSFCRIRHAPQSGSH